MLVLMLAVGVFPVFLMQAHGQQEIDPDHFDQPTAAKANVHTLKAQTNHHATAAAHQGPKHATTARKHSGKKPNHMIRDKHIAKLVGESQRRKFPTPRTPTDSKLTNQCSH